MAKTNIVDWKTITSFVIDAFVGYGIPRKDAEICADILLESDKRGIESHGVNRFKDVYKRQAPFCSSAIRAPAPWAGP